MEGDSGVSGRKPGRNPLSLNDPRGEQPAREFAESLLQSIQTPLLVLNSGLRVLLANQIFLTVYSLRFSEIENQPLYTLGKNQWNAPELKEALRRLTRGETASEDLELEQELLGNLPDSKRVVMIHARRIAPAPTRECAAAGESAILLTTADITAQRRAEGIMLDERERLRRNIQESEEALRANREELRALAASLLHAQDAERRRVSRELHDDVSQYIAKLQFDIETLAQNLRPDLVEEKSRLGRIAEGFSQLSNDLRRIAYGLHPSTLDHLGLAVALRGFCRDFAARNRIRIRFTVGRLPARFPPDVASTFYRITQEALRNIAKHAPASDINVRLTGGNTHAKLTIRDNGPGFDREAARAKGGLGLISMQERSRLIHAAFDITTETGGGATITVVAPLR
ncbi:MAG TPA: sensor histidine kinase [Bryobacteraceae bacterium]|nr:sensor histidine kinase [Bryobacteraceae bacterium]